MKDISILYISDSHIRKNVSEVLSNWTKRSYLKNFLLINSISKESGSVKCDEFKDGSIFSLENLQARLSSEKLDLIRFINITKPDNNNVDSDFEFFNKYINVPTNIKLIYINLLIPTTNWLENKIFNSVTTNANCNILIEPVDRPNPQRVPIDINDSNFYHHTAMSAATVGSLWRGMSKGDFDNEEFDSRLSILNESLNRTSEKEVIISRSYARILIGPDPVSLLIESLSTENGNWVKPNDRFEYSNDDYLIVKNLCNKLINVYNDKLIYSSKKSSSVRSKLDIFSFLRNRYMYLKLDNKLKDISEYGQIKNTFENFDVTTELDKEKLDYFKELIESQIIKGTATRGNTKIPELWKDVREIIFSLIDGSKLPAKYSELTKNQILNDLSVITKPSGENLETLMGEEDKFIQNSDSTEIINEVLEEEGIQIRKGQTLFENLIEHLFNQMNKAFLDFTQALSTITSPSPQNNTIKTEVKRITKRLKNLERFLIVVFINLVGLVVNHFLILGEYIPQIFFFNWWSQLTLGRLIFFVSVIILFWIYLINKIYNLADYEDNHSNDELIIQHSTKRIVELENLVKQTEYWSKVYGLLIHSTFHFNSQAVDVESLDLSFDPIKSVAAKVGTINNEVISDVLESIVKDGWFYEIYKSFEEDFNAYLKNKTLRNEDVLFKLDEENTTELDTNSIRSNFLKYLEMGNTQKILYRLIEDKFDNFNKVDALNLFKGVDGKSIDEDNFITDIMPAEGNNFSKQDYEFDNRLVSSPDESFEVSNSNEELNFDDLSIKAGLPIMRLVKRTDFSKRISIKKISENISEPIDIESDKVCIFCDQPEEICVCKNDSDQF